VFNLTPASELGTDNTPAEVAAWSAVAKRQTDSNEKYRRISAETAPLIAPETIS
jgi:hypothetical protein